MATLSKVKTVVWEDADGRRVKAGTLGATKRTITSDNWYIVVKEGGRLKRIPTVPDKQAATKMLGDYVRDKAHGKAGLTDPFAEHRDRPLTEHVRDYLLDLKDGGTSPDYQGAVEQRLRRVVSGIKAKSLNDVTPDKIKTFLRYATDGRVEGGQPISVTTKNDLRAATYTFFKWLVREERHPTNIVERVPRFARPKGDDGGEPVVRRRRALRPRELKQLIRAATNFPLESRKYNRGGRPRKDGSRPDPRPATLTSETTAKLTAQGRERRLMYQLAIFTGLRRGELSRVRVRHVKLNKGIIDLPGALTKNGRRALIPLVPRLVEELKEWIKGKGQNDPLIVVPCRHNLRRLHQSNLNLAAIPYQTDRGFADWHSLRKTTHTFLRRQGVKGRLRDRFLRHSAGDLKTERYDDEELKEMAPVTKQLARLWRYCTAP